MMPTVCAGEEFVLVSEGQDQLGHYSRSRMQQPIAGSRNTNANQDLPLCYLHLVAAFCFYILVPRNE